MASISSTCAPSSTKAHLLVSFLAEAASIQAAMLPTEEAGMAGPYIHNISHISHGNVKSGWLCAGSDTAQVIWGPVCALH